MKLYLEISSPSYAPRQHVKGLFGAKTPMIPTRASRPGDFLPALEQGTSSRLASLRQNCLERDGYRCVVTKSMSSNIRKVWDGPPSTVYTDLETSHILPHCLNQIEHPGTSLPPEKEHVWSLLNLLDPGLSNALLND